MTLPFKKGGYKGFYIKSNIGKSNIGAGRIAVAGENMFSYFESDIKKLGSKEEWGTIGKIVGIGIALHGLYEAIKPITKPIEIEKDTQSKSDDDNYIEVGIAFSIPF